MSKIADLRKKLLDIFASDAVCMDCVNPFRGRQHSAPLYASQALWVCRAIRETGLNLDSLSDRIRKRYKVHFTLIDEDDPVFKKAFAANGFWSFCGCLYPCELLEVIQELAQEQGVL